MKLTSAKIFEYRISGRNSRVASKSNIMRLGEAQASTLLYHVSIALYSAAFVLSMSQLNSIQFFNRFFDAVRIAALALMALKVLISGIRYTKREILVYASLVVCSAAAMVTSGSYLLMVLAVFLVGSKRMAFKSIVKNICYSVLTATLLVFVLYLLGFIENASILTRDVITGYYVERKALGFGYVNDVGRVGLCMFLCYLFLRFERFGLLQLAVSIALSAFLWFYVVSRTASVVIMIGAIAAFLLHRVGTEKLLHYFTIVAVFAIVAGTLLPMVFQSDSPFFGPIDSLTSRRLYWAHWCLENYKITPFGQPIHTVSFENATLLGVDAFFLDNAYIRLLLNYGIIATVVYFLSFFAVLRRSVRAKRADILLLLSLVFISGVASFWPLMFPLGFPLLALSASLCNENQSQSITPD